VVTLNNDTGCPDKVENYNFWSTVQSSLYVNNNKEYNYYINITMRQDSPNQYFWNMINFKALLSILVFIVILVLTAFIGKWSQSGVVALIAFVILLLIKIILGV
jgi:hypothetical protein